MTDVKTEKEKKYTNHFLFANVWDEKKSFT